MKLMTFIFCVMLATSVYAEGDAVSTVVKEGTTLGSLAPAVVWAIVALCATVGLLKLYNDKQKDDEQIKTMVRDTTAAIVSNSAVLEKLNQSISSCPKK